MGSNNKKKDSSSSNDKLSFTQQQQFKFKELEDNIDNTFLKEYKKIKNSQYDTAKKSKQSKTIKNIPKKQIKGKVKNRKQNKKFIIIIYILFFVCLILMSFLLYHFKTFNHNAAKKALKELKAPEKENYVFLGDSITYRYDLEKYFKNLPVVNSGVNGNRTIDILNDMKKRVYDYNPTKVFILIGTNDLNILYNLEVEEIFENIQKIVEDIEENRPYTKIYLESILPINHDVNHTDPRTKEYEKIIELNKKIKSYAKDKNIDYIDLFNELKDEEGKLKKDYTNDGLHLNNKGYEVVTEILKKYLK